MVSAKTLDKIKTHEDMLAFAKKHNINLTWDIGYRGGGYGAYAESLARYLKISPEDLPRKYGCGCNYLGGGVRGSIFVSGYNNDLQKKEKVKEFLDAFAEACKRAYEDLENQSGLNDDYDSDGDTNWEARATKSSRKAGIISAY